MRFKILGITVCEGGNHFTFRVEFQPSGAIVKVRMNRDDFIDPDTTGNRRLEDELEARRVERRKLVPERIEAAIRESGETTLAGLRSGMVNKVYQV